MRHHHVQAVGGPALKDRDQDFLASRGAVLGVQRAFQPEGRCAHTDHRESGIPKKNATGSHNKSSTTVNYLFWNSGEPITFASADSTLTPGTLLSANCRAKFMRASRPAEFSHSALELE